MIEKFKAFIVNQGLISAGEPVLLAVSGGIDSVVMADLFARAGYTFAIGHCNFSLRGEESDADEAFVKALAQKYGVPCFVRRFDTVAEGEKEGESIQMAARRLRYQWFTALLEEKNYSCVATAHQKNDVLETILFNLCKGSGIAGLHGIPVKTEQVIRPLLFLERQAIENYAWQQRLVWREDSSNAAVKYARNLIRQEVIPPLLRINPGLFNTLETTLERLQGTEKVLQHYVAQLTESCMEKKGENTLISLSVLQTSTALPVVLTEMLKPFHFHYTQAKALASRIQEAGSGMVGKIYSSQSHVLNIDREHLIISPRKTDETPIFYLYEDMRQLTANNHFVLNFQLFRADDYSIPADPVVAALDYDKLYFPLLIRKWEEGDWFRPLGMKGKKKLSDFMIDHKIPLNLKDRIFVLVSGEAIAWVIGYRIDDRFKITDATRQVFQIIQQNKL